MIKTLSALVLSAAVAVTTFTPTSAQAGEGDAAKILGGLAALYIIGRAIDDRRDKVTRHSTPAPVVKPRKSAKIIPAKCYREVVSHGRIIRGYGAHCAQKHVRHAGSLPPKCLRKVHTYRGQRYLYRGKCLHHHGWVRG